MDPEYNFDHGRVAAWAAVEVRKLERSFDLGVRISRLENSSNGIDPKKRDLRAPPLTKSYVSLLLAVDVAEMQAQIARRLRKVKETTTGRVSRVIALEYKLA